MHCNLHRFYRVFGITFEGKIITFLHIFNFYFKGQYKFKSFNFNFYLILFYFIDKIDKFLP